MFLQLLLLSLTPVLSVLHDSECMDILSRSSSRKVTRSQAVICTTFSHLVSAARGSCINSSLLREIGFTPGARPEQRQSSKAVTKAVANESKP